ncbi:MAG: sugar phosphate isomerase/epimerase [Armatimonadetes bacterium]|nr:sugar phosphate isomerase/epimerase [Armatimonadota bacterium]
MKKAMIVGLPDAGNLRPLRDAGFDGVEAGIAGVAEAARAREAAESLGMRIHSVLRGWAEFNHADRAIAEDSLVVTADALCAAQAYGADAVLLVPCRIGGMAMPEPWELDIAFDAASGHLIRVAAGDNAPYADYIAAHDRAWDTSFEAIQRLIPVAEETGVVIAVENVWNNLWSDPAHFAAFVDAFASPWVQAYFDLGNHVKYGPTPDWVRVLGSRLVKVHVKDFRLAPDGHGGEFVNIRDGSVDWPETRRALAEAGYDGWMTIEGGDLSLEEHSRRLDDIIAGR